MALRTKANHRYANTISFFMSLSRSLVTIFLPLYFYHIGINLVNIGIIVAVSVVATNIAKLFAGSFVDYYDRRRVMFTGGLIMALANLSLVFFTTELFFITRGIIFGIGASIFYPAYLSYVWEISAKSKLSTYNAVRSVYRVLGVILAPLLGGLIIFLFGFITLFYTSFFIGIGTLSLLFFLTDIKHKNKIPSVSKIIENYQSILITRGFALLSFIKLIQSSITIIWYTFILIYLRNIAGYEFWQAGLIVMLSSMVLLPFQLPVGRFSDNFHSKWLIIPGFFMIGFFMSLFFMFDHILAYALAMGGFAVGILLIYRPMYVRVAEMTPNSKHGQAIAIFETLTWGLAAIALFYAGEFAELYSIKAVMLFLSSFSIGIGLILVAFHRKISWKYGNHLRRHHLVRLYTPIDQIIDSFPEFSKGFKRIKL